MPGGRGVLRMRARGRLRRRLTAAVSSVATSRLVVVVVSRQSSVASGQWRGCVRLRRARDARVTCVWRVGGVLMRRARHDMAMLAAVAWGVDGEAAAWRGGGAASEAATGRWRWW